MPHKSAIVVLGGLAVLAPFADLVGYEPLRRFAVATNASPAMKVFTSHDGYETFSPRFHIDWQTDGRSRTLTLTPAVYGNVRGPYNRRNVYGAALSYSPVLVANSRMRAMHAAVVHYALCEPAPVLSELGIGKIDPGTPITVRIETRRPLEPKWQRSFSVTCDD
jgi:hypothetical protein